MRSQPSILGSRRSVKMHIEELVLYGFGAGDRYHIGEAVQRELARLLTQRGIAGTLPANRSIEALDAGSFSLMPGAKAQNIGAQAARAVYRGLTR